MLAQQGHVLAGKHSGQVFEDGDIALASK